MCLDDVVMAFYRRVFHTWRHRCSADSGGQLNTRSRPDSVVNDSGSECLDFDNRQDKETRSVESGDVVLDAETFQEMIDELKTLKLTILHLQRMLLQICTSESSVHNNDIVDANGLVRMQHSPDSQELQKRVNELEKLAWEQRRIIDGLNQTSVNEPLCVGCSSDVASSVDIASSAHEPFRFVNGRIEKRNMRTGHRSTSSPLVPSDDKHNVTCNYQYRTNANSVLDSSRDAHKSSCNSVDVQPENRPDCGRKTSSSRCTFSTETGKNFVRQRTRSEEESTVDCSMFDYDGTVDSDHELELGEHSRQIGTIDDPVTHGLNGVIGKRGNTGSEVAFNQQRLGEHSGNMTDFHSGLSDGSYGKSSLGQQGKIGLDFSMSENSIAANDKLTAEAEEEVDSELLVERSFQTHEDFNVRENLSSERKTFVSQSFPSSNDAGENSVAETDYSARTQPDKVLRSTSQSLIRAPKSYGAAAAERKAKRSDDCVSASTPAGAVRNSLLNSAQSKSASLHKTTKQQSREICTSKLPSSNASKLPASIASLNWMPP